MAGSLSLPSEVFRENFAHLQQGITAPLTLTGKLHAKLLIRTETNSKVSTADVPNATKAAWLLDGVQTTLDESSQPDTVLKTLCDVLDDSGEPALERIAADMRSSLDSKIINRVWLFRATALPLYVAFGSQLLCTTNH